MKGTTGWLVHGRRMDGSCLVVEPLLLIMDTAKKNEGKRKRVWKNEGGMERP